MKEDKEIIVAIDSLLVILLIGSFND